MNKKTLFDLIYLRDVTNPKLQKILEHDKETINSHLYNAGTIINENKELKTETKEIIHDYIKSNLKD